MVISQGKYPWKDVYGTKKDKKGFVKCKKFSLGITCASLLEYGVVASSCTNGMQFHQEFINFDI